MTKHRFSRNFSDKSLVLLAPANAQLKSFHGTISRSASSHENLLAKMQRLRGRIYAEDGAIPESALTTDGRHVSSVDQSSWHLLTLNGEGDVLGCLRFRQHQQTADFYDLCLRESAMANCQVWGGKLKASISADLCEAREIGFNYVEIGGWALSREIRGTTEALQSVLAIFAWSQALGGALGVSTATERNGSAAILKRLGGSPMQWDGAALPPYYDERYQCGMEILRFDSRLPSPRYATAIAELRHRIAKLDIVQAVAPAPNFAKLPFSMPDLLPCNWANSLPIAC